MGLLVEHRLHAVVGDDGHRHVILEAVRYGDLDAVAADRIDDRFAAERLLETGLPADGRGTHGVVDDVLHVDTHLVGIAREAPSGRLAVDLYGEGFVGRRAYLVPLLVAVVRPAPSSVPYGEGADVVAEGEVERQLRSGFGFLRGCGRGIRDDPHAVEGVELVEQAFLEPVDDVLLRGEFCRDVAVFALYLDVEFSALGPRRHRVGRRRLRLGLVLGFARGGCEQQCGKDQAAGDEVFHVRKSI